MFWNIRELICVVDILMYLELFIRFSSCQVVYWSKHTVGFRIGMQQMLYFRCYCHLSITSSGLCLNKMIIVLNIYICWIKIESCICLSTMAICLLIKFCRQCYYMAWWFQIIHCTNKVVINSSCTKTSP